jgi:hypothetical protein
MVGWIPTSETSRRRRRRASTTRRRRRRRDDDDSETQRNVISFVAYSRSSSSFSWNESNHATLGRRHPYPRRFPSRIATSASWRGSRHRRRAREVSPAHPNPRYARKKILRSAPPIVVVVSSSSHRRHGVERAHQSDVTRSMTSRNFQPNDIITSSSSSERERDRDPLRVIIDYIRTVVLRALFTRVGTTLLREAKEFAADMIATE